MEFILEIHCLKNVTGVPAGIASANISLVSSVATGVIKEVLKTPGNKKKKHN